MLPKLINLVFFITVSQRGWTHSEKTDSGHLIERVVLVVSVVLVVVVVVLAVVVVVFPGPGLTSSRESSTQLMQQEAVQCI